MSVYQDEAASFINAINLTSDIKNFFAGAQMMAEILSLGIHTYSIFYTILYREGIQREIYRNVENDVQYGTSKVRGVIKNM